MSLSVPKARGARLGAGRGPRPPRHEQRLPGAPAGGVHVRPGSEAVGKRGVGARPRVLPLAALGSPVETAIVAFLKFFLLVQALIQFLIYLK